MALPKVNELPSYVTSLPSTGEKVKYRPFVMKEQKNLLIALETQDELQTVQALEDLIMSCTDVNDYATLATFDVEYLFLQIRCKSVGETASVMVMCNSCAKQSKVDVDLSKIEVSIDKDALKKIKLTDDISVEMKYPSQKHIMNNDALVNAETRTEELIYTILECINKIYTEEEMFLAKDSTQEELIEFVEGMTADQFNRLINFVTSIPQTIHDVEYNCEHCGEKNIYRLYGINDFFG